MIERPLMTTDELKSMPKGHFIMSSSSTSIFICFLTVLSDSPVSLTIVLTDGKQDHVSLFAYRSNALYTILPAGVTFALILLCKNTYNPYSTLTPASFIIFLRSNFILSSFSNLYFKIDVILFISAYLTSLCTL